MNSLPNSLKKISLFLERLPGIGEKTANRLAFYFLRLPDSDLKEFAESISTLKEKTKFCKECYNLTEDTLCPICMDQNRDKSLITVVETVLDLLSFETGNIYNGIYHVLHGRIDPLNNIRPEDIRIDQLIKRTNGIAKVPVEEIILALNPDMEGEATCMYIVKKLTAISKQQTANRIRITRLAYGLPSGASIEYADEITLGRAIDGRREY